MTDESTDRTPEWLRTFSNNRGVIGIVLLALSVAFVAAIFTFGRERYVFSGWCVFMILLCIGCAVYCLLSKQDGVQSAQDCRVIVLLLGGLTGFSVTAVLGMGMFWVWRSHLLGGWTEWQGRRGWLVLGALIGGIVLMFLTLQLVRGNERNDPILRRIFYGSNVFVNACLVVCVLLGLNVLVYTNMQPFAAFNKDYHWVASSIYSLSPKSEQLLQSLDQPVKAVALISKRSEVYQPLKALLENCQAVNFKFTFEFISPDRQISEWEEYAKKYNLGDRREGVLLLFGKEPQIEHRFVKQDELGFTQTTGKKPMLFSGETAIMNELHALVERAKDGSKPIIYFTQGNGELDLQDTRPRRQISGLGLLKQILERKYEVKPLQLREVAAPDDKDSYKEVPNDAQIVIVAGPTSKLSDYALKALRDYFTPPEPSKKKGKLIVLFAQKVVDGKLEQSGLESFCRDAGVGVGDNQVFRYPENDFDDPVMVKATTPSDAGDSNALINSFKDRRFMFVLPRTIDPSDKSPNAKFQTSKLFVTDKSTPCSVDTTFSKSLTLADLRKNISKTQLSVACTVTEKQEGTDHHEGVTMGETPRMLVFGDTSWICNAFIGTSQSNNENADFFVSCLGWLREKPLDIGIEPKKSDIYRLDSTADLDSMKWMPAILMLVGIIGLGSSVWVVRRR